MKRCTKCGEQKPESSFSVQRRSSSGLQSHCKSCNNAYYLANKPSIDVYMSRHGRSARYGKPEGWYEEQLAKQDGGCAICGSPPKKNRLPIDHDHSCCGSLRSCGKCVRGIVCSRCNWLLAALDDAEFLARANAYLAEFKRIEK